MIRLSPNGGFYYRNELWYSEAFRSLTISARELLHCFLNELRWDGMGKKKVYKNNGDLSFTEIQFKELYGFCSATYLKARNQLIEVGFLKQTYSGGSGRGDRARYKLLCIEGVLLQEQNWLKYPTENWSYDIPKSKNTLVGIKTRFKKGKTGRKLKPTLFKYTLNGTKPPIIVYPYFEELPTKVYP